jgi:hypothetical protein
VLEILILYKLCKNIGQILEAKGRPKFPFQLLVVVAWFGGEVGGGILGAIVESLALEGQEPTMLFAYIFALIGAALGAFIVFRIAKSLPSIQEYNDPGDDYGAHFQDARGQYNAPNRHLTGEPGLPREPQRTDKRIQDQAGEA